jgi:hypothetical protein
MYRYTGAVNVSSVETKCDADIMGRHMAFSFKQVMVGFADF